jgi:putative transposase
MENGYIESFHGKFREECRDEHWFLTLDHARETIESWRIDYNQVRPHSSLGYLTPEEFATGHANEKTVKREPFEGSSQKRVRSSTDIIRKFSPLQQAQSYPLVCRGPASQLIRCVSVKMLYGKSLSPGR